MKHMRAKAKAKVPIISLKTLLLLLYNVDNNVCDTIFSTPPKYIYILLSRAIFTILKLLVDMPTIFMCLLCTTLYTTYNDHYTYTYVVVCENNSFKTR
jgi:hypothetical protein